MGRIVKIINKESGKALDVHRPDINKNGAKVHQWDYHGGDNQLWDVEDRGGGKFSIKNHEN